MSILVFWVCACSWARKLLYRMRARVALGIACRLDTYLSANRPYHAYIAGARLDWRASIRWTAKAAMRHLPDLHMERSLWESGICGESRCTKRGHAPACWLTSVAVCKLLLLGLHATTATRTRPATHYGVRLSPPHNLRTISTFFAQMRQTTPDCW